jgi:hypothetical protein
VIYGNLNVIVGSNSLSSVLLLTHCPGYLKFSRSSVNALALIPMLRISCRQFFFPDSQFSLFCRAVPTETWTGPPVWMRSYDLLFCPCLSFLLENCGRFPLSHHDSPKGRFTGVCAPFARSLGLATAFFLWTNVLLLITSYRIVFQVVCHTLLTRLEILQATSMRRLIMAGFPSKSLRGWIWNVCVLFLLSLSGSKVDLGSK